MPNELRPLAEIENDYRQSTYHCRGADEDIPTDEECRLLADIPALLAVAKERDDDREENIRLMGHIETALDELGEPQSDWAPSMVEAVEQLRGAMEPYPNGPPSSALARVTAERDALRAVLESVMDECADCNVWASACHRCQLAFGTIRAEWGPRHGNTNDAP